MKAYMAVVDNIGNVVASVVATNTPVEMLKQVFISSTTGVFDLTNESISARVLEVNQFWVDRGMVDLSVNEILDHMSSFIGIYDNEEAEEIVLDMIGIHLTDDPLTFLATLRKLFNGEIDDVNEVTDSQTFLMAMISL